MNKPDLTVLVPCRNEKATIENVIKESKKILKKLKISGEILVADNSSSDGSGNIARKFGARVIRVTKTGYGMAINAGIQSAKGQYIFMIDADGSYQPKDLAKLWRVLRKSNFDLDVVVGSRFKGEIEKGAMPFLHRYVGTPALTILLNLLFGTKLSDSNSGMRLLKRNAVIALDLKSGGMELASEMFAKAARMKLAIIEAPIVYLKDKRINKKPYLRTWRDGLRHLRLLMSIYFSSL